MGCGKSKHDVVTGNTKTVRKPSEAESVKGKENETIKRQESCQCLKTNDISAVVSDERLETTVDNNTNKPEEKEAGGDCNEMVTEETNDVKKPEETGTTVTSPLVTAIVTENVVPENVVPENVVPENVVAEETVDNVNENVLPVDEQKVTEKNDIETVVVEEEKSVESKTDGDGHTEIQLPEAEEPQVDVQTDGQSPVTTELEVEENIHTGNDEIAATENDEIPVLKDEDKVDVVEEKPAEITKEVESA